MVKISPHIRNALKNYIEEINNICLIEKVILFGSYASGHPSPDSDIDLAIFSKDINDDNRLEFMKIFLMKIGKYKLDIQPLAFSFNEIMAGNNDFILNEIKGKGIEIYSNRNAGISQ